MKIRLDEKPFEEFEEFEELVNEVYDLVCHELQEDIFQSAYLACRKQNCSVKLSEEVARACEVVDEQNYRIELGNHR